MNDRHLQALRQHCIKNRQFNNRNGQNVDLEVTLRLTVSEQSLMFCPQKQVKALTNQKSEIIFKNWCMSCPQHEREEGPSVSLSMQSSKARIRDGMGCTNAHGMGNLHICKGYINAEQYTQGLNRHMLRKLCENTFSYIPHATTIYACIPLILVVERE